VRKRPARRGRGGVAWGTLQFDRVLLVPRWAGSPDSDCYPWLFSSLEARFGSRLEARALAMPEPATPRIDTWPAALMAELGSDLDALARTVLVGHSVGCQAILRALAALPGEGGVGGVLLVAPWFAVDKPWPSLLPWLERDFDAARARGRAGWMDALVSDNDPFTAGFESTKAACSTLLGARVTVVPGAKHFNAAEEPVVLAALVARLEP
jgi:uncharacterized protein